MGQLGFFDLNRHVPLCPDWLLGKQRRLQRNILEIDVEHRRCRTRNRRHEPGPVAEQRPAGLGLGGGEFEKAGGGGVMVHYGDTKAGEGMHHRLVQLDQRAVTPERRIIRGVEPAMTGSMS
jgi:hypothetical protein